MHADGIPPLSLRPVQVLDFTRIVPDIGFANACAVMLDDPRSFTPCIETQTAEKLPWVKIETEHSFERFSAMKDFLAMIKDYTACRVVR